MDEKQFDHYQKRFSVFDEKYNSFLFLGTSLLLSPIDINQPSQNIVTKINDLIFQNLHE